MIGSTEARWFFEGDLPPSVSAWFERLGGAAPLEERTDHYMIPPADGSIGTKLRDGRLEIKRRVESHGLEHLPHSVAAIESWNKVMFELSAAPAADDLADWLAVRKARCQRVLPTDWPGASAVLDVSQGEVVGADTRVFWSVCVEVSGTDRASRRAALVQATTLALSHRDAPSLPAAASMGYPAWLQRVVGRGG